MKSVPTLVVAAFAPWLTPGLYAQGSRSDAASLNPKQRDSAIRKHYKDLNPIIALRATLKSQNFQIEVSSGSSKPAFTSTAPSASVRDPIPSSAQQAHDASHTFYSWDFKPGAW